MATEDVLNGTAGWSCPSGRLHSPGFVPATQPQPSGLGRTVREGAMEEALGSDLQPPLHGH